MLNIITIDPSIICTGATANGHLYAFASDNISKNKKKQNYNKWFSLCEPFVTYPEIKSTSNITQPFSYIENDKLKVFSNNSNQIKLTLDKHINNEYSSICLIEGYSFSSGFGPLVDLVTFGTMVRTQFSDSRLIVLAPSSVKKLAAKLTYPPIKKGKKTEYRNNEGTAGGSFTKFDIYKTLIENDELQTPWVNFLREHKEEILELKKIPKPIEDINDSVVMYHAVKKIHKDYNKNITKTIEEITKT